jgi:hypothetical protein
VPGLRREELADLAGLSVPYLTRLEQGRDRHPSAQVLAALAAAPRLDPAEARYLRRLAEPPAPSRSPAPSPALSPAVEEILASLAGHPALVLTPCRDVLAATPLASAVCPGFAAGQNILRYVFLDPGARHVYINWTEAAAEAVRTLRAAGPAVRDGRQRRLIDELTAGSEEFASLWARQEVREKTIGEKRASATRSSANSPSPTPRSPSTTPTARSSRSTAHRPAARRSGHWNNSGTPANLVASCLLCGAGTAAPQPMVDVKVLEFKDLDIYETGSLRSSQVSVCSQRRGRSTWRVVTGTPAEPRRDASAVAVR